MLSDTQRKKLTEERDALRARLAAIEADYRAGLSQDLSEQAIELENREVLDEIARTTQEQLNSVESKLRDSEKNH